MSTEKMLISDLLKGALNHLKTHGWVKDSFIKADKTACLEGSLVESCPIDQLSSVKNGRKYLVESIRAYDLENHFEHCEHDDVLVWKFNDAKDTTFEDVQLILKNAIVRAEEAGD